MQEALIQNQANPSQEPIHIQLCESFFEKLKGYMFHRPIREDEGLLFIEMQESRVNTSIHMFFVNFDLAVIWLDKDNQVVDTCLAKRWHPFYAPRLPAKMILEIHPCHLVNFKTGDRVSLEKIKYP